MSQAVAILRTEKEAGESWRFVSAVLLEPSKDISRDFQPGQPLPRRAFLVLIGRRSAGRYETVVNLVKERSNDSKITTGIQPAVMADEFGECEEASSGRRCFEQP